MVSTDESFSNSRTDVLGPRLVTRPLRGPLQPKQTLLKRLETAVRPVVGRRQVASSQFFMDNLGDAWKRTLFTQFQRAVRGCLQGEKEGGQWWIATPSTSGVLKTTVTAAGRPGYF